ncbi:MAG TPA: M42 family metallopeptidase [Anaerolineae bacterium]
MSDLPDFDLDLIVDWLVQLLNTPSPTGDTEAAQALVAGWLRGLGLQPAFTRKGAVVVTLAGRSDHQPRAVTAHVDTLGAIVKEIKSNGRLVFDRIGGYPFHTVNGEYCLIRTATDRVYTGTALLVKSAVHVYREPVAKKEWKAEEMEIRLDAATAGADETRALGIQVGDMIAWDPRVRVTEAGYIKSRHLDDKAGVAVMLGALQALLDSRAVPTQSVTFHFSNYEEVGHGAASGIPDDVSELISIDMGALGHGQSGDEHGVSICAKDSGGPYDLGLRRRLVALAEAHGLPYHVDIYPFYGSDAEATLRAGGDHRIGLFGPGVDASHAFERTHKEALAASARLLLAYLLSD